MSATGTTGTTGTKATMATPRALGDLRVVECGTGIDLGFAGKLLADAGAEVIKLEPTEGGDASRRLGPFPGDQPNPEQSALFHYLHAGKQSVVLAQAGADQGALFARLLDRADVLLAGGDVIDLAAQGIVPADLVARHPRQVLTTLTPFGFGNSRSLWRASDLTLCALGAVTSAIGEATREPLTPALHLSDYQAGVAAAASTLLALFARQRDGLGQHVDTCALDVWATVHQGSGFTNFTSFGKSRKRAGRRRHEAYPFHFLRAADGMMCLIARDGAQWRRFIELVGVPALLEDPRYKNRLDMGMRYPEEVDALLHPWFAARTRAEIFALCREHHIPFAPVRRIDDVFHCEQLQSRDFFRTTPPRDDGVAFTVPGFAAQFSQTPMAMQGPAPRLGEHTAALVQSLQTGAA